MLHNHALLHMVGVTLHDHGFHSHIEHVVVVDHVIPDIGSE